MDTYMSAVESLLDDLAWTHEMESLRQAAMEATGPIVIGAQSRIGYCFEVTV